jgi:hypothetical protein
VSKGLTVSAIGPGDFVECVHCGGPFPAGFTVANIYQVSEVGLWHGYPWINVDEMPTPRDFGHSAPGWAAECFRPIYRPKSSIIESLKQPVSSPERVEEPA